ncbi:hypothetical protein GCM10010407_13830 [Rarobacter incanus]
MTDSQVDHVSARIGDALAAADKARDAQQLQGVVTGPAAAMRASEYKIAAATKSEDEITPLPVELQSVAITTTQTWPRASFVVTVQPEDLQPQRLVVFTQEDARHNYELWGWARLFPGVNLQISSPAQDAADSTGLATPIDDAVSDYVDVLNKGTGSTYADQFESDALRTAIETRRSELGSALKKVKGTFSYQVSAPKDAQRFAWRTADGGAIVIVPLSATETAKAPKGATITPDATTKALLGGATVKNSLIVDRQLVVALTIPPTGSTDKMQAVGAENVRTSARLK